MSSSVSFSTSAQTVTQSELTTGAAQGQHLFVISQIELVVNLVAEDNLRRCGIMPISDHA